MSPNAPPPPPLKRPQRNRGESLRKLVNEIGLAVIAPSMLSADFANLARDLATVRALGMPWIHLDVMDGHFVPNITFGPALVKSLRLSDPDALLDVHLMIDDPARYAEAFISAGADVITFHLEAPAVGEAKKALSLLERIHQLGAFAGISIKPKTPHNALEDELLRRADLILVMTVEPGFGGQALIPECLQKTAALRERFDRMKLNPGPVMQVDGGIDPATLGAAMARGAEVMVAGNAIFGGGPDRIGSRVATLCRTLANNAPTWEGP